MELPYKAELWASHKDLGNDHCITASEHPTREAAAEGLKELRTSKHYAKEWAYACVEGPEGRTHVGMQDPRPDADDDCSEDFMIGMAHGIDAYNDARGCSTEEPEDIYEDAPRM